MNEIPCPEPKCGHDIDYHFEGGCEFLHESDEYCVCDFAPSDIVHAILTAEPTEADKEGAWSEYRDGPDYQPTDRHGVRAIFDIGWDAALRAAAEARRSNEPKGPKMTSNNENTEALRDAIVREFDDWPPARVFVTEKGGKERVYEPTDAEVEAFKRAWESTPAGEPGARTRAGLKAAKEARR